MLQRAEPAEAAEGGGVEDGEAARRRFLARAEEIRPRLHRFCARMCGSPLDGEDVVQETLALAHDRLHTLADEMRMEAWLFRIAHHRCVDFLRRERRRRERTVPFTDAHDRADDYAGVLPAGAPVDEALATLVRALPPKERASVLLKDVLDYRLGEIAEIVGSTVGGVKAALHRARGKLRRVPAAAGDPPSAFVLGEGERRLFEAYAACFNRRDWEALGRLIRRDARLEVVGQAEGTMGDVGLNYTGNYLALPWEWRFSAAIIAGETVILQWRRGPDGFVPVTAARLWWDDGRVVRIRDYVHVDYLLRETPIAALAPVP